MNRDGVEDASPDPMRGGGHSPALPSSQNEKMSTRFKHLLNNVDPGTTSRKRKRSRPVNTTEVILSEPQWEQSEYPSNVLYLFLGFSHVTLKQWERVAIADLSPYGCTTSVITGNNHAQLARPVGKVRTKGHSIPSIPVNNDIANENKQFGFGLHSFATDSSSLPASVSDQRTSLPESLRLPVCADSDVIRACRNRLSRAFNPASMQMFVSALIHPNFDTLCVLPPLLAPSPAFLHSVFSALVALHNDVRLLVNVASGGERAVADEHCDGDAESEHIINPHIRFLREKTCGTILLIRHAFAQPSPFIHSASGGTSRMCEPDEQLCSILLGITAVSIKPTHIP